MIKKFTVGGIEYKVVEQPQILDSHGGKLLHGYHDSVQAVIKLATHISEKEINKDVRNVTLWHEVLHACLEAMGWQFESADQTEEFIERLSRMLYEYEKTRH